MEFDEVLKGRRSIREYLDKEVNKRLLAEILDAGRYAPNSGNVQNWRFVVVENIEKRKNIAIACSNQLWMMQAPVYIVVCNKVADVERMYSDKAEIYSVQNCAACIENILLAATNLGLAGCWVGSFDEDKIIATLKIPDGIKVEAVLTIGYGAEKVAMPTRHRINFITYFDDWGNADGSFGTLPIGKHKERIKSKIEKIKAKIKDKIKR